MIHVPVSWYETLLEAELKTRASVITGCQFATDGILTNKAVKKRGPGDLKKSLSYIIEHNYILGTWVFIMVRTHILSAIYRHQPGNVYFHYLLHFANFLFLLCYNY